MLAAADAVAVAAPLFVEHGWTYGYPDGQVPDRDELMDTVCRLIENVLGDDDCTFCSSGRFTVMRFDEGDGDVSVEISLDLASAHL